MATPFSQLVGIQAVLNVVTGKRYSIVPDEVIQYAAGFYGQTVAPIDPDVQDMIMAAPRAKQVAANPPEQPTIGELRKRYGTDSDDELILRALVPEPDLEKMRAAFAKKEAVEKGDAQKLAELLAPIELEVSRKSGENDQLFGSVTSGDIAEDLEAQGYKIDKRQVQLHDPLKALGDFPVKIKVFREISAEVKVQVAKEE